MLVKTEFQFQNSVYAEPKNRKKVIFTKSYSIRGEKMSIITLTNKESIIIKNELVKIQYDAMGGEDYVSNIRQAAYRSFPKRVIDILNQQKSAKKLNSHIIFDNIPIDDEVYGSPAFHQTGKDFKSGDLSENVICAFGLMVGDAYSIAFEGRELVNNLTPQKETKMDYTGLGSEVELDFHIENAALRFMSEDDCSPIGMFLLGIRRDPSNNGPKTYVSDARVAIQKLSEEDIEVLRNKNFIIRLPYRWRSAFQGGHENTDLCAVLTGSEDLPRINVAFYPDMVLPVNERAKTAYNNFYQAIKSVAEGIEVQPKRLVYIDNRFTLHAREKFSATYDDQGLPYRWVQRLFITSSLWNFRRFYSKGDRVFDANHKIGENLCLV